MTTLTTAQQVRLRVQDIPTIADEQFQGDGMSSAFLLYQRRNITSASAYVLDGAGQWSATAADFGISGQLTFSSVIPSGSGVRARYVYSVFSDTEVDHFIEVGGSVAGASLEVVDALLFDSVKRARWMAPDGTQFDDTAAMNHLLKMRAAIESDLGSDVLSAGGMPSWSIAQGDY